MQRLFIGGEWVEATGGGTLPVIDPSTGEAFDTLARGQAADVDRAVAAARAALAGPWGTWTATERGRLLGRMSTLIQRDAEALAQTESRDCGKPIGQARNDIAVCARYFEYYAGAADKLHGEVLPYLNDFHVAVLREPYGVTAHILPWNYPAQMFGRSIAVALATGNAAVLKPAEDACLTPLKLAALLAEAGLPAGALNIVTGLGEEAGAALAAHPGINLLSFTGSPETGRRVQRAAAASLAKCVMELGGKSPQIVFDDADLERALPFILKAITQNTGQTCSAGSRLLVQRGLVDELTRRVAAAFREAVAGPPALDAACGPLINAAQKSRVESHLRDAESAGIPLIAQGRLAAEAAPGGFWCAPMLYGPVPRTHRLAREEVFGPVLALIPFDDEDDAVALANGTDYGLVAAVWTRDGGRQTRLAKRLQCGQVFINCYGAGGGIELPFGGVKQSGHGREKGFVALDEYCVMKTVVQYHGH